MDSWEVIRNDAERLRELYEVNGFSMKQIGEMHGVTPEPVRRALLRSGIKSRPAHGHRKVDIPKDELNRLYQNHTMAQIAAIFSCGETVVFNRLKEYGIKVKGHEKHGHKTKDREFSDEHISNLRASAKKRRGKYVGENSPHWKGGATEKNLQARRSGAYRQWRKAVLNKFNNQCQECGIKKDSVCECCMQKSVLHVHHIKSFSEHPELRYDVNNGEVLCAKCHYEKHHD